MDFLHRVGRTARAGQYGLVTSLYTESNRDLVDTIRRAAKLGHPVVNINSCCYKLAKYMVFGAYKALLKAYPPPTHTTPKKKGLVERNKFVFLLTILLLKWYRL